MMAGIYRLRSAAFFIMQFFTRYTRFKLAAFVTAALVAAVLGGNAAIRSALAQQGHAAPSDEKAHTAALQWPQKPITIVLGFPAGSGVDVIARIIQSPLSERLGVPVVIEYKPGAAGNLSSSFVARSQPDGYTFALGTAAQHGSNAALYKNLSFDVEDDFVPIAPLIDVSNVLTVNPKVINVATLQEFVREVQANPDKYNYASTGIGAGTHMAFAEFNARLGLKMVHVPYKGGPQAITAVLTGETCCIMNQVQTVLPHYQDGKVRLLGVTTAQRVPAVQEIAAIAESGLPQTEGFDSSTWFGIFAPKGLDARIVQKLNETLQQVLQLPQVRERFESQGNTVRLESPAQFKQTVRDNRIKWAKVVEEAKISIMD